VFGEVVRLDLVDKVAAGSVGAVALGVECAAEFGLVLGVAHHGAELVIAVGELTLLTVFARAVFLVGATQFGFVALCGCLLGLERACGRAVDGVLVVELLGEQVVELLGL